MKSISYILYAQEYIFADIMELELSLFGPSSIVVSSTFLEMELFPFQFHQN